MPHLENVKVSDNSQQNGQEIEERGEKVPGHEIKVGNPLVSPHCVYGGNKSGTHSIKNQTHNSQLNIATVVAELFPIQS